MQTLNDLPKISAETGKHFASFPVIPFRREIQTVPPGIRIWLGDWREYPQIQKAIGWPQIWNFSCTRDFPRWFEAVQQPALRQCLQKHKAVSRNRLQLRGWDQWLRAHRSSRESKRSAPRISHPLCPISLCRTIVLPPQNLNLRMINWDDCCYVATKLCSPPPPSRRESPSVRSTPRTSAPMSASLAWSPECQCWNLWWK